MKTLHQTLVGLAITAAATCATASDLYYGLTFNALDHKVSDLDTRFNMTSISAKAGWNMTDNIAFEARLGQGLAGETESYNGYRVTNELGTYMAAYARYNFNLNDNVKPYVLLGASHLAADVSVDNAKGSAHDSDWSYGIGSSFVSTKNLSFNLEYVNLYEETGETLDSYGFGVEYSF